MGRIIFRLTNDLGIVYDRIRWEEKALLKEARALGVEVKLVDAKQVIFDSSTSEESVKKQFGEAVLQRCISHIRGLHVAVFLELKGVKVINEYEVSESCGNKLRATMILERAGIPTPKSVLSLSSEYAVNGVESIGYPAVFKPVIGSWGRLIVALRDREMAQAFIDSRSQMDSSFNQVFYFQEMVKRPPRDIRCIMVGGKIVACTYRYAPPGEWRTNIAVGGKSEICPVTPELEELVLKVSGIFGGGILGVDLMESPRGLLVNEINPTVEFRGASSASETNIPRSIIEYALNIVRE